MDSKTSHNFLPHLAWIIPLVGVLIAFTTMILDHMDKANVLFSGIWNYLFVNIWYIWVVAAGYGLYRFVRLIQNFHNVTNKVIPTLMTDHIENTDRTVGLVEKESKSRVSAIDTLSDRINSLDTRRLGDRESLRKELQAELSQAIQKQAHQRIDGINALVHQRQLDYERMNMIETSLPNQTFGRIQEIEKKLTAQITALNNRVEKVESSPLVNINSTPRVPAPHEITDTHKGILGLGLGLANSIPRNPTQAELLEETIKKSR